MAQTSDITALNATPGSDASEPVTVSTVNGTRAVVAGDTVIAQGDHIINGLAGRINGTPYYHIRTDRTVTGPGGVVHNTTSIIYGGREIGEGYFNVNDLTLGNGGRLYYIGSYFNNDTVHLRRNRHTALTAHSITTIIPYGDSIAALYEPSFGDDAIYADGRTINNGSISYSSLTVIGGDLTYIAANLSSFSNPQRYIVHGEQRIGPFNNIGTILEADDRLAFTFWVEHGNRTTWYLAREQ